MLSPRSSNPANSGPSPAGDCSCAGRQGGRLNLLLSYGGCHPDPWVNRLPPLLEPMGVTSYQAATGKDASRVLQTTPIHIAVVDLGLPLDGCPQTTPNHDEEGGTRLLELLSRLHQPPPTIVVKRGRTHRDDGREIAAALRLGAFAVVDRPREVTDLNLMLDVLRRAMTRFYQGRWPEPPPTALPNVV